MPNEHFRSRVWWSWVCCVANCLFRPARARPVITPSASKRVISLWRVLPQIQLLGHCNRCCGIFRSRLCFCRVRCRFPGSCCSGICSSLHGTGSANLSGWGDAAQDVAANDSIQILRDKESKPHRNCKFPATHQWIRRDLTWRCPHQARMKRGLGIAPIDSAVIPVPPRRIPHEKAAQQAWLDAAVTIIHEERPACMPRRAHVGWCVSYSGCVGGELLHGRGRTTCPSQACGTRLAAEP